jgi:uncharacterized membrane protein (DUF2068 family)
MSRKERGHGPLLVIAIYTLAKAALLLTVAAGAHHLLHHDVQETLLHWVHLLRADPDNHWIHTVLSKVTGLTDRKLAALSVGTLLYACLFTIEGVGLILAKKWAEYLTVVSTALLIPLEIYEIARHVTWVRIVILVGNVLIVAYLIAQLRRPSGDGHVDHARRARRLRR